MGYFTTSQLFLFPSFDLDQNEQDKLDVLLAVLEESGIGEIIERCTSHDDSGVEGTGMIHTDCLPRLLIPFPDTIHP